MKVYCINNSKVEGSLTVNKLYDVIRHSESTYYVINNRGYDTGFLKYRFLSPEDLKKQLVKERFEQK